MRKEENFLVSVVEFRQKIFFLNQLFREDPYNGVDGYPVRSVYFDANDPSGRELRLRTYDPRGDQAVLEVKEKKGEFMEKRTLPLCRAAAQQLLAGDFSPLLTESDPDVRALGEWMQRQSCRPGLIVSFIRTAFFSKLGDARLTFDRNLVATRACSAFFEPRLPITSVLDQALVVLEVKHPGTLPEDAAQFLSSFGKSPLQSSKFALARQQGPFSRD